VFLSLLHRFALRETLDAFMKPVHLDQLGTANLVLGPGRKLCITAVIKVERDDLGDPVTPNIKPFARAQALEEIQLLLAELEQLSVELAIERRVGRNRNEVQEFTMESAFSPRSFADCPIMVTPPRFLRTVLMEASAAFEQLLVLHVREDLFDQYMLGDAQVLWVIDDLVDAAQNPDHQRFDQVGVLLVVNSLKVEALEPGHLQAVLGVVEDA
jgi:hypothetical protein